MKSRMMSSDFSDDEDIDIEVVPLTSRIFQRTPSSGLSSTATHTDHRRTGGLLRQPRTILLIREASVAITIFLVGWLLPRYMIAHERVLATKQVPFQVTAAGDVLLDFALNHPLIDPPTIPSDFLVWASVWIPCVVMAIAGWLLAPPLRRLTDAVVTVAGLITAIGVSEGATQFLKLFIQRRRPNFYELCGFDIASRQCIAALKDIRESQFSFPSGHSSLAACSMTFMSWYFVNKIVESNALRATQKRAFSLVTCCLLPGWAVFIGATRLVDHWHHPSDVVAGLVLGSVVASITYHTYYYPLQQQAADADPLRSVY